MKANFRRRMVALVLAPCLAAVEVPLASPRFDFARRDAQSEIEGQALQTPHHPVFHDFLRQRGTRPFTTLLAQLKDGPLLNAAFSVPDAQWIFKDFEFFMSKLREIGELEDIQEMLLLERDFFVRHRRALGNSSRTRSIIFNLTDLAQTYLHSGEDPADYRAGEALYLLMAAKTIYVQAAQVQDLRQFPQLRVQIVYIFKGYGHLLDFLTVGSEASPRLIFMALGHHRHAFSILRIRASSHILGQLYYAWRQQVGLIDHLYARDPALARRALISAWPFLVKNDYKSSRESIVRLRDNLNAWAAAEGLGAA